MGGGAASFDYDNDGDEDIYIVGGQNPDGLFENDGTGNFTDVSLSTGISMLTASLMTTSVVTGDIDNDGIREIFIGTMGENGTPFETIRPNYVLKYNSSTATYQEITAQTGISDESFCMGAHFFDSNQDGYLDLYLINYVSEPRMLLDGSMVIGFDHDCYENVLYINAGDGTFSDQTEAYGLIQTGCSLAATSSDLDGDGDPDLIVANDFGKWLEPNQLYQNEGPDAPYIDISETSNTNAQMYGMGIGIGDFDEDLDLDFYVTNIGENHFFVNEGNMMFANQAPELDIENTETPNELLTTGWGAIMEDFNNDSYLDLFVSNGYVYSAIDIDDPQQNDEIYLGSSDYDFYRATDASGIDFLGTSRGALFGDWNADGRLDLITVTNEPQSEENENSIKYYENISPTSNWIGFKLKGTSSNADAFGTQAIIYSGDRALIRECRGGDSHASQNSSTLHFGLGDQESVDSVSIYWPSGRHETIDNPSINSYHQYTEGLLSSAHNDLAQHSLTAYPNPASQTVYIDFKSPIPTTSKLQLVDALGEKVLERHINDTQHEIDISHLPSGIYTLINQTNNSLNKTKIILITH